MNEESNPYWTWTSGNLSENINTYIKILLQENWFDCSEIHISSNNGNDLNDQEA